MAFPCSASAQQTTASPRALIAAETDVGPDEDVRAAAIVIGASHRPRSPTTTVSSEVTPVYADQAAIVFPLGLTSNTKSGA
jgi:hypothetical protein